MDTLLAALPVLACPIAMGAMMWWMARKGHDHGQPHSQPHSQPHGQPQGQDQEIAQLRAELDELRGSRES